VPSFPVPVESGLVIAGRFAAVSDEFLADIPLGVERDPPGQRCLLMRRADLPPEDASTCAVVGALVTTKSRLVVECRSTNRQVSRPYDCSKRHETRLMAL
jgi:hypothetical protein